MNSKSNQRVFRGTIMNWQLHHLSIAQEKLDQLAEELGEEKILPLVITGTVKKDPTGRMQPGWHMRTTPLTLFDEENGLCETRNSSYKLEGDNGSDVMPDMGNDVFSITYD